MVFSESGKLIIISLADVLSDEVHNKTFRECKPSWVNSDQDSKHSTGL